MSSQPAQPKQDESASSRIEVQYEQRSALYASQFVLNGAEEELVLDCSSGLVVNVPDGRPVMPIHTRLAMSWGAAAKLAVLLNRAVAQHAADQKSAASTTPAADDAGATGTYAKLPAIEATHAQHQETT
jgi:hypothetical protein